MKLSFVIELLLIFLLIAFAASRVIDSRDDKALKNQQKQDDAPNRYCSCSTDSCDCCRKFSLPVIPIQGPGCASLQYIKGDNMALTLKFGDRVLATHTISGKRPKPVCMRLPGGFSKFCGRVYGISREPDSFRACLGLEIRALDDLEAALRVSCFRFSPEGLRLEPAKPLPAEEEDDEDEDDYGFGDDDDDESEEEEEDEEEEEEEEEDEALGGTSEDEEDDDIAAGVGDDNEISADYAGFSILGDLLGLDDDSVEVPVKKKPNKKAPAPVHVPTSTQTPHKVIVQVHHIHDSPGNTEVVVEAPEPEVTNNKVMDMVETSSTTPATTAKPTKAPTKVPNRGTTKAPTRKPATKPTTAAPSQATTEESPMVTVMDFKPSTSSEYNVNVVQDGQMLQTVEDVRTPDAATEPGHVVDITTMMPEGTGAEEGEKVAEVPVAAPEVMVANDETEKEEDKQEVGIGVVKEEEVTAAAAVAVEETSMPAAPTAAAPPATSPATPAEEPTSAPAAVVPSVTATSEKDEDDADADDVVEEVEDAVASVFSAGVDEDDDDEEEDEEEEEEEEADKEEEDKEEEEEEEEEASEEEEEEEETEKPQEDEDDDVYDDDEEEEDEEKEDAASSTTENPTTTTGAEKRWRRRKNRLDHIFWQ